MMVMERIAINFSGSITLLFVFAAVSIILGYQTKLIFMRDNWFYGTCIRITITLDYKFRGKQFAR